ncbi:MAG: amidohydrolase family protein [Verrucomicrobiota bacterium]|nr:amidohydrolase family protein [Verrucomicrobiota bacterium]
MYFDGHVHCDTADKSLWKAFFAVLEESETKAVLCTAGKHTNHSLASNETTLECANAAPDNIVPYAYFDLWEYINSHDVEKFRELGFRGLKCITPYHEYDHDIYMPIYEMAEKLSMPILFHTGSFFPAASHAVSKRPFLKNMRPLTIDRIARSFQNLKIVMAHMGTTCFRHEASKLVKMHNNIYTDLAGSGSWMAIQPTELRDLLSVSMREIDAEFTGFHKLLLGSDAYVSKPEIISNAQDWYNRTLDRIGVPPKLKEKIMGGTLELWLQ